MIQRQKAIEIFLAGVESVKPKNLIRSYVSIDNDLLWIGEISFDLTGIKDIYVVGFGKASAAMSQALESILGPRITRGYVITKYGHSVPQRFVEIIEAGHPVPDENGIRGTERILSVVTDAGKDDLVICLISGSGSALLADVPERCTLEDLRLSCFWILSSTRSESCATVINVVQAKNVKFKQKYLFHILSHHIPRQESPLYNPAFM